MVWDYYHYNFGTVLYNHTINCSPEEAYKLSDMIINSNYLKSYEKTL